MSKGTGRTTRMIEAAQRQAKATGRRVYIVAASKPEAERLRRMVNPPVQVITPSREFCWDLLRIQGVYQSDVFVDHATIEKRYGHLIAEYHRWDA